MQPRRTARELALLGISQLPSRSEILADTQLPALILAAVRALSLEARETLETAAAELSQGHERLRTSESRSADQQVAQTMVAEAIALTETAINRLGAAIDLPEILQLSQHPEVRDYALELIQQVNTHRTKIDDLLTLALIDWQVERLARIDRDILRMAVAEILFLQVPPQVAINEAVEVAKRYSSDDGHRFINGVLRRVVEQIQATLDPRQMS